MRDFCARQKHQERDPSIYPAVCPDLHTGREEILVKVTSANKWPDILYRPPSMRLSLEVQFILTVHVKDDLKMETANRGKLKRQGGVFLCFTWSDTEDFVKVSTNAHLLVELRGLGQVRTGFEVGDSEDICATLTGSC